MAFLLPALAMSSVSLADQGGLHLPSHPGDSITLDAPSTGSSPGSPDALQVFVGPPEACCEGRVPVAGRYVQGADALTFIPAFAFVEGQAYTARVRAADRTPELVVFTLPVGTPSVDAAVTEVFPSGDLLPENMLRFYIHFSVPMSPHVAFDHIELRDASGLADEAAFMRFKQELWNADRTRLTVLFDPGRIKRDVATNRELGPALEVGQRYRLSITGGWTSADGRSTLAEFSKSFTVSEPLRQRPDVRRWQVAPPPLDTRGALEVRLDRPFDRHGLATGIGIVDSSGQPIEGEIRVGENERSWSFIPDKPWSDDGLRIVVDPTLEDVAGNNFRDLLDQPVGTERTPPRTELALPRLKAEPEPDAPTTEGDEPDDASPWTYRLNMGGNFVGGNLFQIQLNGAAQLVYDRERVRNEIMANGFRLWLRGEEGIVLFGDDVTLGNLFTLRSGGRLSGVVFTYLTWSQLHRIDLRLGAGAGPMWQLLEGKEQSLRVGALGFVERTAWPGTTFNRPIAHSDGALTIPRLTLLSNARLAAPNTPLSFQYMGYIHINPFDPGDVRGHLQGSLDVRIAPPLHISLTGQLTGSSVVLTGVGPVDTRTTVGLALTPPATVRP